MELRQYIGIALKWWWLMVVSAVVAAGAGYLFSQRQMPVYQATTTLIVGQSMQATELTTTDMMTSERLARTYADMARRQPVLQAVVEVIRLQDSWEGLQKRVTVNPVRDTQLLEITVEADSRDEARVTADQVAQQLIRLSPTAMQDQQASEDQRFARERLQSLKVQIEAGQERLLQLQKGMDQPLSVEQVGELEGQFNTLQALIADWENNYAQLLVAIQGEKSPNYLAVIEPAQAKAAPVRPRVRQDTLLAGVVGLMLALGVIFLVEYLDDTLKSPQDLQQSLGLPALGMVGQIRGKAGQRPKGVSRGAQSLLITHQEPFAPESEAYRMIRSNIQFMAVDRPIKTIMVTSPTSGEGKSVTVANLGVAMAQAGLKTIIVDTDLRRPMQHQLFQVSNVEGLTNVLRSPRLEVNGHLAETEIENLRVLTSGEKPPNPSEMLGSQRMGQLMDRLSELADVLIFDSPPVLAVADATILSTRVDGLVLVTEAGQTRRDAAQQAIAHLQQAGANLLGGVLNRMPHKRGGYYYNYYSSYYSDNGNASIREWLRARLDKRTRSGREA